MLANIYLHYTFDLSAHQWRKQQARGEVILVRYANDFGVGLEHRYEEWFRHDLTERIQKFYLELYCEKACWIELGRYGYVHSRWWKTE